MTVTDRLEKLRRKLAEKRVQALLVSQPENRFYLSGFNGSAGFLLITEEKAVLATDFRYIEQAQAQAPDYAVFKISGSINEWLPGLMNGLHVKRLGFEAGDVTFDLHNRMISALKKEKPRTRLVPVGGLVESLRVVKEPGEIAFIRKAVKISDAASDYAANIIRAGMTEKQLAWEIEKHMRQDGSESLPFEVIVASGPNSALPHARPSERKIKAGEPVVIDIGARFNGYASDITRTVCAGDPDETFRRVYNVVLDAQLAAVGIIREGTTGDRADSAAREVITQAGYGEAFGHSLGHGVGLAAHELPRLGPGSSEPLTDGMVFTIEPGIYLPGWGGIRIEDTAMIKNGKAVFISAAGKVRYD